MFLKNLHDVFCTIRNNLTQFEPSSPEWQLEQAKMQLLKKIIHYIKTDAVKRKSAQAKLDALMKSHFDYRLVARMFNTSIGSIQSSISYLSQNLESKVGGDTLNLLMAGNVTEAESNFLECSSTYSLDDLLICDIRDKIPYQLPKTISITECQEELNFLKFISKSNFSKLDINKLIFLRYILESTDSKFQHERQLLYHYIVGKTNLEELIVSLNLG